MGLAKWGIQFCWETRFAFSAGGEPRFSGGEPHFAGGGPHFAGGEPHFAGGEPHFAGGEPNFAEGEPHFAGGEHCSAGVEPRFAVNSTKTFIFFLVVKDITCNTKVGEILSQVI